MTKKEIATFNKWVDEVFQIRRVKLPAKRKKKEKKKGKKKS